MSRFRAFAALCAHSLILLMLAACSASEGHWPKLASAPPAAPVALLPAVETPPPGTADAMTAAESAAFHAGLPDIVDSLSHRYEDLKKAYEDRLKDPDGDRAVPGARVRALEMLRSRLGMLESEIGALRREAERAGRPADEAGAAAIDRLAGLAGDLAILLRGAP
ncbi:MAG: hypothetical protein Tsb008_15600 [Rhodothalassiaceae bacterium]